MTDTINITAEISDFARHVREQLADLSPEEVDDLTDGLEADMSEAFLENPSHALPDPQAYAVELRTAAGLPVRETAKGGISQSFAGVADSIRLKREGFVADLRKNHIMATFLDFMVEMRPAWWLVRAWVAFQVLAAIFGREGSVLPFDGLGWTLLLILVVISVQWGRKRWLPFGWLGGLILVGNIAAALLLIPSAALANATTAPHSSDSDDVYYSEPAKQLGVTLNGNPVSNIYAYGADGEPLAGVQLFDQDGKPINIEAEELTECLNETCSDNGYWLGTRLETGATAWNVFPMRIQPSHIDEQGSEVPDPEAQPLDRPAPFLKVPAILPDKAPEKVEKGNE